MKNIIIRLENVWKIYKMGEVDVPALRGINLDIKQGEFIAIMGKSGSGKSTMLNSVGCLDIPTKGEIYLDGENISNLDESELATIRGKKIGFVFQQFNLLNSITAIENIELTMMFQGVSKEERRKRSMRVLENFGLKDRAFHRPTQLSGGEQQRIAIARALANDPDVILADEPTGNLDTKTGNMIINFLKDLHKKQNKTIILVTHDLSLAKNAQRIVNLKDGVIGDKK